MIGENAVDKLIKSIRQMTNLNQEQFAKELGTTVLSINRWENGKSIPNRMAQKQLLEFIAKHCLNIYDEIIDAYTKKSTDDNSLILYHGSKSGIEGDIRPISRKYCDFGKGFYMGTEPSQPLSLICDEKKPKFYTLKMHTDGLKILNIDVGIEWAMLIAYYRGYMKGTEESSIYQRYANMAVGYDMILGYIADDRMYRVMKSFFEREITDVALINSLSALDLGRQYVCLTDKACNQIEILSEKNISPLELCILKDKSIQHREEGIALTEDILVKFRREGKYFDELLVEE